MKIAVFLPNWIGDAVMATPALRALRQQYPDAHFTAVVKPYVAAVLDGSPWFDDTIYLDSRGPLQQRWWAVAWRLWQQSTDWAVLFPNSFRSAFVPWLAGCRRIIGFNRYARRWMLTDSLQPLWGDGDLQPTPIIDDYNRLAERAGCPWPGHRMELFTTPQDEAAADEVWQQTGLENHREVVCLNPGAAFGSSKHWHAESFASLAQELVDRRGSGILILCGPAERQLARTIAELSRRPGVHSLADHPVSLGLTKACIRRSDLLITTDSGPRHFATAFDRPVVTLFGPTHIGWTETYHPLGIHLQKKVDCGPCQQRVCSTDHRCMKLLTPGEVFAAAQRLLAPSPKRKAS
ncbi:MAG TPA: lipopolysaccharide heptosyltransferase II [Gemmataceae bacterium]|nr:lipopolysaccharide heptosyltransferase II [Gemmataceae bacterium]